ncbi:GIY-YIG nuclease family protein [Xylanibacter oryzae]|uniref:GIY-YIG nuclease family protein n=1 Tax=Xylanibacter oryzae TaxID=185293 RepID=UPI0004B846D0|nr:GIY-YIG nuclease family protein [Xylanibacter oryzae]
MDIDKELDEILNDPILDISDKEKSLFDIPADMKRVQVEKSKPDYVAQRKVCENFGNYQDLFNQVHADLKAGRRSLIKVTKTYNFSAGHFYVIEGQILLLEQTGELSKSTNGLMDGRTRCIFENGTESDILLQTLRKSVVGNGYAITETQEETDQSMMADCRLSTEDKVTGYIYVLSSLSQVPEIANQKYLYKIGFTVNTVEERITDAAKDPTYLMAPVKIEASYKIVNLNSHVFETLIHQVLDTVQMQISITDNAGNVCHPKEWYVVPLPVIDTIIKKILDGSITKYSYNSQMMCLEKTIVKSESVFDTTGMKVLTLNIKKVFFDEIMKGEKKIEYRELKQTKLNKYTYIDETDGKRYLRRYDVIRLHVGYNKNSESAIVEVTDITYNEGMVEYHLGSILEHLINEV